MPRKNLVLFAALLVIAAFSVSRALTTEDK